MERIRDEIEAARERRISFHRFMELALYEPGLGYYRRRDDRATRTGDYLSAPEMDPIFGAALAVQVQEMWNRLGEPRTFVLREHGAGAGALPAAVVEQLRRMGSRLVEALRYEPVEVGPERLGAISARLAGSGIGASGPSAGPWVGCLLANELIDALPVHRLEGAADGSVDEVGVTWQDGWFADASWPADASLIGLLTAAGGSLAPGERTEVRPGVDRWLAEAAAELDRGYVVLIDYGDDAAALRRRMPEGTVRTYRRHEVGSDPFRAVGETDLTAHVDFAALERAAVAAGLTVLGRTSQAEFVAGLDIGELLVELRERPDTTVERYLTARSAVARLLDPAALGRFRVLILGHGVDTDAPLRGLSFRLPVRGGSQ